MTHQEIENILTHLEIKNYHINEKGMVDVAGSVNLRDMGLTDIPVAFGRVEGSFNCAQNQLTSLMNSPLHVGGDFICDQNLLPNLLFSPLSVEKDFFASHMKTMNHLSLDSEIKGALLVRDVSFPMDELIGVQCEYFVYESQYYDRVFLEATDLYQLANPDSEGKWLKDLAKDEIPAIMMRNHIFQDKYKKHQLKIKLDTHLSTQYSKSRCKI